MSLADNILRRRQELEGAFRQRYNPMEGVVSALADIEQQAFTRKGEEEKRKREADKFGLEKTETEARTERLKAEALREKESELALAEQRRQRGLQWEAEAATARQEARRKEQEASLKLGAQDIYGRLQGTGQSVKDLRGAASAAEAEKRYAASMAKALGEGTPENVKRLDEELAAAQKAAPKAVPGGITMNDAQEVADAYGIPVDAAMAMIAEMEAEAEKGRAEMGLVGEKAKTEQARQRELDRRRRAAAGGGAPATEDPRKARMQELAERKALADMLRSEEKLARDRMASGAGGQFALTEGQRGDLQKRRTAVLDRATAAKGIRDLIAKYPDMEKYVGTIDQYISSVRAKLGSKQAAEILSALGRASDEYRTAVTGAAASDKERTMLESRVPNAGDNVSAILGKLSVDDEYFRNKLSIIDGQFAANDIRGADALLGLTSPVSAVAAASSAAAPKKPPTADQAKEAADLGIELE